MADKRAQWVKRAQRKGWAGKIVKLVFNLSPVYKRTGGKITYVSNDLRKIDVAIRLNRKTRNYVGSVFGGSMFSATDPIYMFQLLQLLGDDYVVWDKKSEIRFIQPGRTTLFTSFEITDQLIDQVKMAVEQNGSFNFVLPVVIKDAEGKVVAEVDKTIYAASKVFYQEKHLAKKAS